MNYLNKSTYVRMGECGGKIDSMDKYRCYSYGMT